MSRRTKIIIGIVVVAILALLVWLIVAGRRTAQPVPLTSRPSRQSTSGSGGQASIPSIPSIPSTPTFRTGAPALDAFARSFTERYGSFSNQSGFVNLKELLPFMTEELRKEAEVMISRGVSASVAYSGTTTKALSVKEQKVGDSAATFLISTQRRDSTTQNPAAKIYYQDLELSLLKVGTDWKVNRAVWK